MIPIALIRSIYSCFVFTPYGKNENVNETGKIMTGQSNARDMLFDPEVGVTNDKQVRMKSHTVFSFSRGLLMPLTD